jgi:membrane protein DedA with SNARE-associated domain
MIEALEHYGAALIFAVLFLDQAGAPIPATPLVLALGALARRGTIDPVGSLLVAAAGSVCASLLWFHLGRRFGARVLATACRISLEPDTCVSRTKDLFARHGAPSLLLAKFLPALDILAAPLAGALGIRTVPFVLWSSAGALLWLVVFGGLGYLFGTHIAELLAGLGGTLGLVVVGLLAAYAGWKVLGRRRALRELHMARITPEELQRRIASGEEPVLLDVRNELSLRLLPFTIPGAILLAPEELDRRHHEIPRDRDVIVYCT